MGIYDQLEKLNGASPASQATVESPVAGEAAEMANRGQTVPPRKSKAEKSPTVPTPEQTETAGTRSSDRTETRTGTRLNRRTTVRYAFEFYQDQIEVLRHVSLEAKLLGDDLSMSEMVREALDDYITHKNLRTDGRTDYLNARRTGRPHVWKA